MPSLGNGNRKFQLPAFDFKFGSLTEGTDIPPPPPSPKQDKPREQPKASQPPAKNTSMPSITTNGTNKSPETATSNGLKWQAEEVPLPSSPSSSIAGQGSIRRLFSRNRLDSVYANGEPKAEAGMAHLNKPDSRPDSRSNASIATDKQSKRASGFFRRFRGSDGKVVVPADVKPAVASHPAVVSQPTSQGPPPPKLPEFRSLGSKVDLGDDGGSLGDDLFKNIK